MTKRRKIILAVLVLLGIGLVTATGVFFAWLNGPGFDNWVKTQVIDELKTCGIEAEFDSLDVHPLALKVDVRGMRLRLTGDIEPFMATDHITGQLLLRNLWTQDFRLQDLKIEHPVVRLKVDEQGKLNLARIKIPETPPRQGQAQPTPPAQFLSGIVALTGGEIFFNEERYQLNTGLKNLRVTVSSQSPALKFDVGFSESQIQWQTKKIEAIELSTQLVLDEHKADVKAFEIKTPYGETSLSTVVTWETPASPSTPAKLNYEGNLLSKLDLKRIATDFLNQAPLGGQAQLTGKIIGDQNAYRIEGNLKETDLSTYGATFSALSLTYDFASPLQAFLPELKSQIAFRGVTYDRYELKDFQAKVHLTPQFVDIEPFEARVLNGKVQGTSHIALGTLLTADSTSVNSQSTTKLTFSDLDLQTALAMAALRQIPMTGKTTGTIELAWPELNVQQATGTAEAKLAGVVTSISKPKAVTSDAAEPTEPASASDPNPPAVAQSRKPIPFQGDLATKLLTGGVDIQKLALKLGDSTLDVKGLYQWNRQTKLDVHFQSPELAEAQELAERFGVKTPQIPGSTGQVAVGVGGAGEFTGVVSGLLTGPTVSGTVSVAEVRVARSIVGKVSAEFESTPQTLTVKQALFEQPQGGTVTVDIVGGLSGNQKTNLNVTIDQIRLKPIGEILAQIYPPGSLEVGGKMDLTQALSDSEGRISGSMNLINLPPLLALAKGEFLTRSSNGTVSLPKDISGKTELTADQLPSPYGTLESTRLLVSFEAGKAYRLDQFVSKLPFGALTATGAYDVVQSQYTAEAHARDLDLTYFGEPLKAKGYPVTGIASLDLTSQGKFSDLLNGTPRFTLLATSPLVTVGKAPISNLKTRLEGEGNGAVAVTLASGFADQPYEASGKILLNLDTEDTGEFKPTIDVVLNLKQTQLTPILAVFDAASPSFDGEATGSIRLIGPLFKMTQDVSGVEGVEFTTEQVNLVGDFSELRFGVRATDDTDSAYEITNEGPVKLSANASEIEFQQFRLKGEDTRLSITGRIGAAGKTTLGLDGDVNLKFLRNVTKNTLYTSGVARLKAAVSGTLDDPRITGTADIDRFAMQVKDFPLILENGGGRVLFTNNQAQIDTFTADAGGGKVELSGGAVIDTLKPVGLRWRFGLRADNVRMNYPQDVRSLLDGDLVYQGNLKLQILQGTIKVKRAEYTERTDLVSLLQSTLAATASNSSDLQATVSPQSQLRFDVRLEAPESLFVRNNLADMVGTASLRLSGSSTDPRLIGRVVISRGQLELRNDRYQITRGIVVFPEARSEKVFFDIQAETELQNYRVIVGATGNPDKFSSILRSEPALPQSSIVTLLATGNLPPSGQSQNDPYTTTQTGVSAASSLVAELFSERVEERTNKIFGINRFQIDPLLVGRGNDPTARVTIGRRITKDLSITYSTNLATTQEQIILVEYRLSPTVSVIGIRDQRGNFGVDVRFTKRF
ncbi:MAG TPA: translocation/assembly module TamB domain-containing protein [Acidobacteriota bacterium]|nr:translocation/assembly module TamB domain-containing protein [Acidobacteriota bacterium]